MTPPAITYGFPDGWCLVFRHPRTQLGRFRLFKDGAWIAEGNEYTVQEKFDYYGGYDCASGTNGGYTVPRGTTCERSFSIDYIVAPETEPVVKSVMDGFREFYKNAQTADETANKEEHEARQEAARRAIFGDKQ